jgi:SAM-dependent methyltransferase
LAREPGLNNVLGIEAAFAEGPLAMDFLDPRSPFHGLKALSTRIYQCFMGPYLKSISHAATVLDAGCGIGRFSLFLARRFERLVAFDPSPASLRACGRHLEKNGLNQVELHWADLSFLDDRPAGSFDLVVAMELICYVSDPALALRRLVRAAKTGAVVLLSVEGRPGAPCSQGMGDPSQLLKALQGEPLLLEGDRFVRYFDPIQLEAMLREAGLTDVAVEGSHYFGEGPFWQSMDDSRLFDPAYVDGILEAEEFCRSDALIAPWARVFSAAGRKA